MTDENQTQNDEDFDYGCECAMTLFKEPTEDCLNDLIMSVMKKSIKLL